MAKIMNLTERKVLAAPTNVKVEDMGRRLWAMSAVFAAALLVFTVSCKKNKESESPIANDGRCFKAAASPHAGDGKTALNDHSVKYLFKIKVQNVSA